MTITNEKSSPSEAATAKAAKDKGVTPMMVQFMEIKGRHPGYLLFYRMGDFYELFFDDAVEASGALDITLTKRGKHLGEDIPMCGVPVHSADGYLERLIRQGFKVAVCEQTEDPAEAKKRGAKSVVARDVVRLVTPGTLTEDTLLDARAHNYLMAVASVGGHDASAQWGLAWLDMSTGELSTSDVALSGLAATLARLAPGEVLISEKASGTAEVEAAFMMSSAVLTPMPAGRFDSQAGEKRLKALYNVGALDGFGQFTRAELAAGGTLIDYVDLTQKGTLPAILPPRRISASQVMSIDAATRANLELTLTLQGQKKGTLLSSVDRTVTNAGARTFAARLASPSMDASEINARLDSVAAFLADRDARAEMRSNLTHTPDIQRALSRLTVGRGGPRDLAAIGQALARSAEIGLALRALGEGLRPLPVELVSVSQQLRDPTGAMSVLAGELAAALSEDMPLLARDGGFVKAGYSAPLDEVRTLRDESRRVIAGLQKNYQSLSGVSTLKIKHNNVLGYFIDVSAVHGDKLMNGDLSETFIHRQTLANAVRFTTTELGELASRIANASGQSVALELEIFDKLVQDVAAQAPELAAVAHALATIDISAALAQLAEEERYTRPQVDASDAFEIRGGRHPVVEQALRVAGGAPFVANDCALSSRDDDPDARRIWLVTGPNMAGKSTFLRQNALIAILAQMGSYVPATSAHIGVVDQLFSRVGAADDLARGRSTFMVEMVETAAILNQATSRSLVILDEIGRGTATFDGLSIAWAAVEHLHEVNASRALFATHYHELTALSAKLDHLANVTIKVKEWEGDVVFLHEVVPGAADRSYGIQVAKLAGLPGAVIERANAVLETLEKSREEKGADAIVDDLPLFSAALEKAKPVKSAKADPTIELLDSINADELTPREALNVLYRLKAARDGQDT